MQNQLDPQIKALTMAIRQTETGGDFKAVGKSGEYGAYQFTQPTWDNLSQKYLGQKVDLKSATPEQQNEVAYKQIADWKNSGMNVGQVASMWNAGVGEPNAYTGTFSNGKPSIGTNSYGVKFDVPAYAKSVATAYQTLKTGGNVGVDSSNPSSTASTSPDQSPSLGGFIGNIVNSGANVIGGLGEAVMHPIKTLQGIGDIAQGTAENTSNLVLGTKFDDKSTQTASNLASVYGQKYGGSSLPEIIHNIGKTIYNDPVGTALDLSTILDGVGAGVGAIGKVADVSKAADLISMTSDALKSTDAAKIEAMTTPSKMTQLADAVKTVADYTNPLAPVSKAISGTANKLADLTTALPRRIINNLLPQLKNSKTIDYAIDNIKLGSADSMLAKSVESLDGYNAQIKAILTHPDYAGSTVVGGNIIADTLKQFPNSEYTADNVFSKIKSQVPGSAALVTKLEKGSLSLDEANILRQAIDKITYKTAIDSPEVRAGKELAEAFGNSLRNTVKETASETKPIFANYSKEINLKKALEKLTVKQAKKGAVSLKELLGVLGGTTLGGPVGGAAVLAGEKIINTPAARVLAAKGLQTVAVPAAKAAAKAVSKTVPLIKPAAIMGRINQANQTNQQ